MSLKVRVERGDVLDASCDVVVSTGNVQLNMSGGVNGAILQRGGQDVQAELRAYLAERELTFVAPGTVVRTGPGPLPFRAILHAVAIDGFYQSTPDLVKETIEEVLRQAEELEAASLAMPTLATGYGPLKAVEFAEGLADALAAWARPEVRAQQAAPLRELRLVLWQERDVEPVKALLQRRLADVAGLDVA